MLGAMSALRETAGVVVVRCLHCGHEGTLSQNALTRFGLNPDAPIAAYVKRLRCSMRQKKRHDQANDAADPRKIAVRIQASFCADRGRGPPNDRTSPTVGAGRVATE